MMNGACIKFECLRSCLKQSGFSKIRMLVHIEPVSNVVNVEMEYRLLTENYICWNATYESLLGSNKSFPQPIPLSEMIDFLVDVWEQEGLYD
ncbi:hypothetical protein F3Y22_tig00110676pilonHSYRG00080 [Hibiscus syriacus]|uniref:Gag1-like clamp domain-containing protein n=1 Tax=Hibiscus syriacus TaxID=106335 RepID=A0A6A2ZVU8_HIBSY|nr:hypothetical protein F3Y22_tig00110676pilonHSYRG00080 [Hibiscus syriacus]